VNETKFVTVLRVFNEAQSADELVKRLQLPADLAAVIMAQRAAAGGMFTSADQVQGIAQLSADKLSQLSDLIGRLPSPDPALEAERQNFSPLLLENPNYFGNVEGSPFKPVKPIKGNTTYEQLICLGLQPSMDRLEAVIQVKKTAGYGGDICSQGSFEYVRFFVDLNDNGIFHDVGATSVNVHNIPGAKPLCYAVYLDFTSIRKLCFFENIVKVRASLSWNAIPPSNPNFVPVWGNVIDAQVQIRPAPFVPFGDIVKEIDLAKVKLPDPIGPVIHALNPNTSVGPAPVQALSLAEKRRLYAGKDVPVHRFAFQEVQPLLASAVPPAELFTAAKLSTLGNIGLEAAEISGLVGKLQVKTDGDTSFEQLTCVGSRPAKDVVEGVLTVKKPNGYSGQLCGKGSTEFVGFWADFGDGTGFHHLGTSTVQVHDLQSIPAGGVQYGVFLKTNFAKWRVPCLVGARIAKLRAILSWETPPTGPNYVPVWGNRMECLIQIRPGAGVSHVPLIETIGDVPVNFINQATGLATGNLEIAHTVFVNQSPFGGEVTVTGEIGLPPDSRGGGALPFKYKIEVKKDDGVDTYHPLLNDVEVSIAEWDSGAPHLCNFPFPDLVCQRTLHPTNDSDGLGDGWYPYLEDSTQPLTRHLVLSILGRWQTTPAMEGTWKMKITAKDPNTSPPTVYHGVQEVLVRIDNTYPVPGLNITGATFNGNPITAVDCGKFPVGTIITGTYSAHDPGTVDPLDPAYAHFGGLSFDVFPSGPAHGASVVPSSRSFPVVPTTGEDGTWTLNTAGMDPCGYVIHMTACDRTNMDSRGNPLCRAVDVGFCLEAAPPK
jgi:hypothetical protein